MQSTCSLDDARRAALLAEYAEVNGNFRLLTNIRFKLLAILPLAPAVAAILTATAGAGDASSRPVEARAMALSLFGLIVTAALANYNARNDQIYLWHVDRAASIERELGIADGSFASRPIPWFEISLWHWRWNVGHVSSVTAIYLSSMALWLLVGVVAGSQLAWGPLPTAGYLAALLVTIAAVGAGWRVVHRQRTRANAVMRDNADRAIRYAAELKLAGHAHPPLQECDAFVACCASLSGKERSQQERKAEIRHRIDFYAEQVRNGHWGDYARPTSDEHTAAAQYVALIVDLPPLWLMDTPRRRGIF